MAPSRGRVVWDAALAALSACLGPLPVCGLMHCNEPPGCDAYPAGLFPDFDCRLPAAEPWDGQIDWDSWRRYFGERPPSEWSEGDGAAFLDSYMDSGEEEFERHWAECPLGVLNAAMFLYSIAVLQGEFETASFWAQPVRRGLTSISLRILLGSKWPLFTLFTSERLRERRPDVLRDEACNCAHVSRPALNWERLQSAFYGEGRKDWSEKTMRYVLSWQMNYIPELLEEECPLGVLTINAIRAFNCATSESSCFHAFIQKVETWLATEADSLDVLAHSRWPLAVVLNHMCHSTRHEYKLDFAERELVGSARTLSLLPPSGLPLSAIINAARDVRSAEMRFPTQLKSMGRWGGLLAETGASRSFRDAVAALSHLGPGYPEAPTLVYISMVYGSRFSRHIRRFCARARALGPLGERLVLMALDDEALRGCLLENGQRCMRGTPSIVNKFTMPLVLAHLGLDSVWIDFDTFLMRDPTPAIVAHGRTGPRDILVSGSFEADCICNGIVFFRATDVVRTWLLAVVMWMYHHPYEHDQKTFSAFLNYTESVQNEELDLPPIPSWDTLDPINQFVTPDTFEGNGWTGELDRIIIYHFLNGESDTGSGLDPSGTWMREHGNFQEGSGGPPPCRKKGDEKLCAGGKISLMDLFYLQDDEELYTTPKPAHENAAIRRALLASRKETRRADLLGMPCGPMVGVLSQPDAIPAPPGAPAPAELLEMARAGRKPPWQQPGHE